jgi:ABC-type branched-subunit amino acid transport system ATPase component
MLEIKGVTKAFAGVRAVSDVHIAVREGEFASVIGPNGSGKTTLFNCVTGFIRPDGGTVLFQGRDITGMPPFKIARLGMARTFQSVRLFAELSVLDNLLAGIQEYQHDSSLGRLIRSSGVRRNEAAARRQAMNMLDLVHLAGFERARAGALSYGQRKLLSIAVALMSKPRLVLLDEPTAAVNPTVILSIRDLLKEFNDDGQTFLLIEHNMEFVMSLSKTVTVLDAGQVIASGSPAEVRSDRRVLEAYLGG